MQALSTPNRGSSAFSVLGERQFKLLFIGTTLAQLAFGMMQVVQGVVAFELTGKNSAVGFVALGTGISMLFLGPIGGTLSDRMSKRRILMFTQVVIGVMFGIIAGLIFSGAITILILAGASLVMGSMFAAMGPTRQAWLGDLLEGPDLASGVALQQLMMNATRIVGPLAAGLLIAIKPIGTAGTYTVMAAIFAVVVFVLALMAPTPPRPRKVVTSIRGDLAGGFRYIWSSPEVRLLTLVFAGVVLSGFSYQTIMPGFLENELGHPASQLGIIFGTTAVGGIVTTLYLASHRPTNAAPPMFAFGAALAASLFLLALAPGFFAALAIAALVGASSSGFQMLNNVNLMQRTAPEFFGRVMAVTMMSFGLNSIVAYPVGQLADHIGERPTMAALACLCMTIVVLGFTAMRTGDSRRWASAQPRGVPGS
ncbi:MAG: MFS transporter [Dehalococcoidia bacterium]|nr:MFS transporter [Dehalococcoidia bacterium]MCB9485904.1 MFS transporter [Thermoflexaceae bacterium]